VPGSIVFEKRMLGGKKKVGFKFDEMSNGQRERLYHFLFVTEPRRIFESGDMTPRAANTEALQESRRTAG